MEEGETDHNYRLASDGWDGCVTASLLTIPAYGAAIERNDASCLPHRPHFSFRRARKQVRQENQATEEQIEEALRDSRLKDRPVCSSRASGMEDKRGKRSRCAGGFTHMLQCLCRILVQIPIIMLAVCRSDTPDEEGEENRQHKRGCRASVQLDGGAEAYMTEEAKMVAEECRGDDNATQQGVGGGVKSDQAAAKEHVLTDQWMQHRTCVEEPAEPSVYVHVCTQEARMVKEPLTIK